MQPAIVSAQVRQALLDYLRTTLHIAEPEVEGALFDLLDGDDGLFRGPWVQVRLPFASAAPDADVPLELAPPFVPWQHQLEAFRRLTTRNRHRPENTLVTTGTGSGKTECFLYPVLDHCLQHAGTRGIKAIILYPMNALATDQAGRIARLLHDDPRLRGKVTAGLYVGGEGQHKAATRDHLIDDHKILRQSPPDILLTNYKMLDFLLLRPEDQALWRFNVPGTLRHLVIDELHTFDGAQGSDVAYLIRRLKARLDTAPGVLCCVGTSATLGSAPDSARRLLEFAEAVFGEPFGPDAIVSGTHLPVEQVVDRVRDPERERIPHPDDGGVDPFDPRASDPATHLADLQRAWLGEVVDSPAELGRRLRRHVFLEHLLRALAGQVRSADDLVTALARRCVEIGAWKGEAWPVVASFLTLLAAARGDDGRPLLHVGVGLWVRELRRLVRVVQPMASRPQAAWRGAQGVRFVWEDGPDLEATRHEKRPLATLPMVCCRECGATGYAARESVGVHDTRLERDPRRIGDAWLTQHPTARLVRLGHRDDEPELLPTWLCPVCLRLGHEPECRCGRSEHCVAVTVHGELTDPPAGGQRRFRGQCPECSADGVLSMLGARLASLSSVALSQLFLSPWADDADREGSPKLLAFTDSVQDASHRAGYFAARTWRFNLRIAMQATLEAAGVPLRLSDLGAHLLELWEARLGSTRAAFAAFLPPDLRALPTYRRFVDKEGKGRHLRLRREITERLGWEAILEFGLRVGIGRTLERTGCAVARPLPGLVDECARRLREEVVEHGLLGFTNSRFARGLEPPPEADFRHFVAGLLHRVRLRGGVAHPWLTKYIESGGHGFHLSRRRNPLISPFGRRATRPRFLSDKSAGRTVDVWRSRRRRTWFSDWAVRALGLGQDNPDIDALYDRTLALLEQAGVLASHDASRGSTVHGLVASRLEVLADGVVLGCTVCNASVTVGADEPGHWVGRPCVRFRCGGSLRASSTHRHDYYRQVFRAGRVRRIFSEEHTGLLGRPERELLEERFKRGTDPDAPNVLVATPTLEMGIDIGDLSATMLCTVPPTTASYLQRVGRAGRSSGRALTLTFAATRPHDLHFFARPERMLDGAVEPPGCYLDSPDMLRRQLAAFAMDTWARQTTSVGHVPAHVNLTLGQGRKAFLDPLLEYVRDHAESIAARFLALFGSATSAATRDQLEHYARHDLAEAIDGAFAAVQREIQALRSMNQRIKKRRDELDAMPSLSADPQGERDELNRTMAAVLRVIEQLQHKYPLNVLTDEGVLPNYAFPEPGVVLQSVVRDPAGTLVDDADSSPKTRKAPSRTHRYEFQRPASAAIRELAPFNVFYADGRRVRIDEVDVGSAQRSLIERWRFCPSCSYSERELGEADATSAPVADTCPRCADPGWADTAGQVREMVHFRRARSFSDLLDATTNDTSEERERFPYLTRTLVDVAGRPSEQAHVIESRSFGFQHLRDVVLREVNFGPRHQTGHDLHVAGERVHEVGFVVCRECGRVEDKQPSGKVAVRHAAWCRYHGDKIADRNVSIYLYRQVRSEAICILLPVADVEVAVRVASLRAALQLGLRERYGGQPAHLLFKHSSEPIEPGSSQRRRFLVLYDGVPGGTGMLSDLARPGAFRDLLERARAALEACDCVGGCYRCVYAYQNQYELPDIEKRVAAEVLTDVLAHWDELARVVSLSEVRLDHRLESELEVRFLAVLERHAEQMGWSWRETWRHGLCNLLRIGERSWRVRRQVWLGEAQGVDLPTRADFLIEPVHDPDGLPVAVYLDGEAWHALPGRPRGRIHDDLARRRAILASGRYRVWSLTWFDLDAFERGTVDAGHLLDGLRRADVGKRLEASDASTLPLDAWWRASSRDALSGLLTWLEQPDAAAWRATVTAVLPLVLLGAGHARTTSGAVTAWRDALLGAGEPPAFEPPAGSEAFVRVAAGEHHVHALSIPAMSLAAAASGHDPRLRGLEIVLRLRDDAASRAASTLRASWVATLRMWNLLQFLPCVAITSTEEIELHGPARPPAPMVPEVVSSASDDELDALRELILDDDILALVVACRAAGLPLPEVGEDLIEQGRVAGMVELMWRGRRVIVVTDDQEPGRQAAEAGGWQVFDASIAPAALVARLQSAPELAPIS